MAMKMNAHEKKRSFGDCVSDVLLHLALPACDGLVP